MPLMSRCMHNRHGCSRLFRYVLSSVDRSKRNYSEDYDASWQAVPLAEVKRFIQDCMVKVGTRPAHATSLADNLVAADYRGHYSHGLNRLDMYVRDIETRITVSNTEPTVVSERCGTAFVDGNNLLGPVVGNFCMDLAIAKAMTSGIGWVVAKGSNHFGIAGWYAMQASQKGFLGMAFCNTSPLSVPTRARSAVLGTNPISLAAPAAKDDDFVLDMATTTAALGKVELHDRKGLPLPNSWGVDVEGKECNNPRAVIDRGGLMPLGGSEVTAGYKGYGLAMMVEIFCGILAGSDYGLKIRTWRTTDRIANLGQCFVAVDPSAFAPGFEDRMADLMHTCRTQSPIEGEDEVLVAGDPERKHMALCKQRGGIPYHPNQIKFGVDLARRLGVKPMDAAIPS